MDKKEFINQQATKTLEIFNELDSIEPDSSFFRTIEGKLFEQSKKETSSNVFSNLKLRPIFLSLLLLLNLVSAAIIITKSQTPVQEQSNYTQYAAEFISEYSLGQNTYVSDFSKKMTSEEN